MNDRSQQSVKAKQAQSLVVMIAAGGAWDEVVVLARALGVRATHVQQLAVPEEQDASRRLLIQRLKRTPV